MKVCFLLAKYLEIQRETAEMFVLYFKVPQHQKGTKTTNITGKIIYYRKKRAKYAQEAVKT